ncbi:MAG TPA: hypothetical protein PL050_00030 [Fimbriimonadaceae bacterium]|nr:hypothetical protein [Fimbriimonadaceae bacterium]
MSLVHLATLIFIAAVIGVGCALILNEALNSLKFRHLRPVAWIIALIFLAIAVMAQVQLGKVPA